MLRFPVNNFQDTQCKVNCAALFYLVGESVLYKPPPSRELSLFGPGVCAPAL